MELQTNEVVLKERLKPTTIIGACGIGLLSIVIVVMICIPSVFTTIMSFKGEIFKGVAIGGCTLPMFLFVTIKGGKLWYKKAWTWICVLVVLIAVLVMGFVTGGKNASNGMGGMDGNMMYNNMNTGSVFIGKG